MEKSWKMSTIASPRGSIALSSRPNSTSTTDTITTDRPNPQNTSNNNNNNNNASTNRRNRSALRDYYNLQTQSTAATTSTTSLHSSGGTPLSSSTEHIISPTTNPPDNKNNNNSETNTETLFDSPHFNPATHTTTLLTTLPLPAIWRIEANLTSQIRTLDGEKKSLVYDNYAKLITATETIRKMRERMDPMTPATRTLASAIGDVGATAESLRGELRGFGGEGADRGPASQRMDQRETVRWVLAAPQRLRRLVGDGREEEAKGEWRVVRGLLGKWEGVKGVNEVRGACEEVMKGVEEG